MSRQPATSPARIMTHPARTPLTADALIHLLSACNNEFATLEALCTASGQEGGQPQAGTILRRLLSVAGQVSAIVVDGVAALAALGRIPVAHCCAETPPDSLHYLAGTVRSLFALTDGLRNATRDLEPMTTGAVTPAQAAVEVGRLRRQVAALTAAAECFVASWPAETDSLDLASIAASPAYLASAIAAARANAALRAPERYEPMRMDLHRGLDEALYRVSALAGQYAARSPTQTLPPQPSRRLQ